MELGKEVEELTILNAKENKFSSKNEEKNEDAQDQKKSVQPSIEEFAKKLASNSTNLEKTTTRSSTAIALQCF
ncbi:hypothetical protein G6F43_000669 [Rhizopus delemar]|nr:hypothetical protein G6F43_000669 [Rhizopus delemar]